MEKIRLRLGSLVGRDTILNVANLKKSGNNIVITIPETIANRINSGETVTFLRSDLFEDNYEAVAWRSLQIIANDKNTITVEIPKRNDLITITNQFTPEMVLISGDTVTRVLDQSEIDETKGKLYYVYKLSERINIFEKDILFCKNSAGLYDYTISLYDYGTNEALVDDDIRPMYEVDGNFIAISPSGDTIDRIRTNSAYVTVNQNEYFAEDKDGNITLWGDLTNGTITTIRYIGGHINIPIQTSQNSDFEKIDTEQNIHNIYDSVVSSIIPDVIDYEKVKYNPVIMSDNGEIYSASALSINLHFRQRRRKTQSDDFEDGWFIDTAVTTYWRDYNSYEEIGQDKDLDSRSDNLCELNFTDDDVKYRKSRLKQSFLRLSFYNSKDPFTQSLLYYSTIFVDATDLCGKYIKLKTQNKYQNVQDLVKDYDVDEKYRLSTRFDITDEFDRSRSSEGFYLYLFSDDAPSENENSGRTIYMKVEFNHAGYGKTIPLIIWPKDENGNPAPLYAADYFDASYIEVNIQNVDGKYVYYIKNAENNKDGLVQLNLFEPIISPLLDA